ncbi:MAG: Holliday junction branch migration protein RuvA [Bacteroidaceae bacterium]|nr:Holliday junction branch migration protein RuvA [Bacteroidaceae bacterium]
MIDYIRGSVEELSPTEAVLEAHGVGYKLAISLNTFTALQDKKEAKLYAYEAIREDAYQLFGFISKREREIFELLISISGIGGQTARMILSAYSPTELANIICNEQTSMLKSVKGIGPKAAQRIIVELKDKISVDMTIDQTSTATKKTASVANLEVVKEAVSALTMLGFSPAPTQKVVMQIAEEDASLPVEQIIKRALKML